MLIKSSPATTASRVCMTPTRTWLVSTSSTPWPGQGHSLVGTAAVDPPLPPSSIRYHRRRLPSAIIRDPPSISHHSRSGIHELSSLPRRPPPLTFARGLQQVVRGTGRQPGVRVAAWALRYQGRSIHRDLTRRITTMEPDPTSVSTAPPDDNTAHKRRRRRCSSGIGRNRWGGQVQGSLAGRIRGDIPWKPRRGAIS